MIVIVFSLLISIASFSVIMFLWSPISDYIYQWKKHQKIKEEQNNMELLSLEDKRIYNKLPNKNNFVPIRFKEIQTSLQISLDEVALSNLAVSYIETPKKHKEIHGPSITFNLLGTRLGVAKRKIDEKYEYKRKKVHSFLITNKRIYIDTEEMMYKLSLKSIILVQYSKNYTLRIISSDYSKSSIYLTFKSFEDMSKFIRIHLTQVAFGRIHRELKVNNDKKK